MTRTDGAGPGARAAGWPAAVPLTTRRLRLEPLRTAHAAEAFPVLVDERLYTWTGEVPLSPGQFEARLRRQSAGRSPGGMEGWLNWMLRLMPDGALVGTVQATLRRGAGDAAGCDPDDGDSGDGGEGRDGGLGGGFSAELAWVTGHDHQRNGYAREGALAVARWLREQGAGTLVAHIRPGHTASEGVARALGLVPTKTVLDGETRWSTRRG